MVVYDSSVIKRFYVHNFRCLENFELPISGLSSALLIGNNGSGKTTVGLAFEILQRIARGTNRVGDLVKEKDFSRGRSDVPMRFEVEVELGAKTFGYGVAFKLPEGFKELRVLEEKLTVDGNPVYTREVSRVHLAETGQAEEAKFLIDYNLVALPILAQPSTDDRFILFPEVARSHAHPSADSQLDSRRLRRSDVGDKSSRHQFWRVVFECRDL